MDFDENLADFGCGLEEEGSMSKNAAAFLKSYARTCNVFNTVNASDQDARKDVVREYLNFCYERNEDGKIRKAKNPVDFSLKGKGIESITSQSLPDLERDSLSTLYLVEFFTHCCINCIHSIEDVRLVHEEISEKFKDSVRVSKNGFKGLKVLSVHSPKFPREKDLASIAAFCKRNRMDHSEVVNDPGVVLWNEFGVTCWPTILILGPNPEGIGHNLLFNFMGEGHRNDLLLTLTTALKYFIENLNVSSESNSNGVSNGEVVKQLPTDISPSVSDPVKTFLRFPGKVTAHGDHLVISDSGNNRLVLANAGGEIIDIIGGSGKGCKDGSYDEAQFYNPQGVAFENDSILYVADTGNHAIRKVDISSKKVYTFINPGRVVEVNGESQTLKSPWDLTFYNQDILIVAAAGNHRLFGYFFNNVNLFGVEYNEATFAVIAGSGREENRNNSYILKASFAQPSGISTIVDTANEKYIYIADSESSSVRSITPKGQVVGVVGGSRDPTDLFAFGDTDGKGVIAKLQHPMGVCPGATPSHIFVADTYNHKIKKIDVSTKECVTFVCDGLNEPSGICKDPKRDIIYIADTNNHSVKIFDLRNGSLSDMTLKDAPNNSLKKLPGKVDKVFELPIDESTQSMKLDFLLSPLPDAFEGGQWKIISDDSVKAESSTGSLNKENNSDKGHFSLSIDSLKCALTEFYINVDVFFCGPNSCLKRTRKMKIIVKQKQGASTPSDQTLEWPNMQWND